MGRCRGVGGPVCRRHTSLNGPTPGTAVVVKLRGPADRRPTSPNRPTPTPGWDGAVYVSSSVPKTWPSTAWKKVATITAATRKTTLDLDTAGQPYRYYLIWITKLPSTRQRVQLSEVDLLQRKG